MARNSVPISVRIPADEADFLASLNLEGALSLSEKLRAVIAEARSRRDGAHNYLNALKSSQESLAPTLRTIRNSENAHDLHSELVGRLAEWLPDCFALMVSAAGDDETLSPEQLTDIERRLADRSLTLMQSILQIALTPKAPCYDPDVFADRIDAVLGLAELVAQTNRVNRGDSANG